MKMFNGSMNWPANKVLGIVPSPSLTVNLPVLVSGRSSPKEFISMETGRD